MNMKRKIWLGILFILCSSFLFLKKEINTSTIETSLPFQISNIPRITTSNESEESEMDLDM